MATAMKLDGQTQVRGKCQYWRERLYDDDRWDIDVAPQARRVRCSCFIEGATWEATVGTLPEECPNRYTCRYHVPTW